MIITISDAATGFPPRPPSSGQPGGTTPEDPPASASMAGRPAPPDLPGRLERTPFPPNTPSAPAGWMEACRHTTPFCLSRSAARKARRGDAVPGERRSPQRIPPERLASVAEHYYAVGGVSPINQQCRDLLAAVRADFSASGLSLPVYSRNMSGLAFASTFIAAMRAPSSGCGAAKKSEGQHHVAYHRDQTNARAQPSNKVERRGIDQIPCHDRRIVRAASRLYNNGSARVRLWLQCF